MRSDGWTFLMSAVIKVGGVLLEDPGKAAAAVLSAAPRPLAIVHGGGIQITRMMDRMKVSSVFVEGLRVTDQQTLEAVATALLGEVHSAFVAALRQAGLDAVGVFGCVSASRKKGPWGLVGTDVKADGVTLQALIGAGKTPVLPTLAVGRTAEDALLNANGDETAAAVAVAIQPSELIFLTDVEGVRDGAGLTIGRAANTSDLLGSNFVSGGMIPKLKAVKTAMDGGIAIVRVGRTVFGGVL
jgi:acetylglutamate kinase